MQIRLTVLAPRSGHAAGRACDVLVTAPAGTALAAVASGLATAAAGPDTSGTVVLYSGRERLDAQRRTLGEPPLIDGAVLSLQVPGEDDAPAEDAAVQLHVVAGPDAGGVHLLHGGRVKIGRSADADVPLDDPDVSRLHCAVTVGDDGRVSVADLGSTNGTTLEGEEVGERPVRLAPGALLRLGESALRLTAGDRPATLPTASDGEGHLRIARPGTDGADPLPYSGVSTGAGAPGAPAGTGHGGPDPAHAGGSGSGRATGTYSSGGYGADGSGGYGADGSGYGRTGASPGPQYGSGPREPAAAHGGAASGGRGAARGGDTQGRGSGHGEGPLIQAYGPRASSPIPGRAPGPQYGGPQYGNPPGAPRVPDPRASDTRRSDTRGSGTRGPDPRGSDPRSSDTHSSDTHGSDARGSDLRGSDLRASDVRDSGSRGSDTHFGRGPALGAPDGTHSRAAGPGRADGSEWRSDGETDDEGPRSHSRTTGSRRQGTPTRGTELPDVTARRRGGIGAWARRLAGGRDEEELPESAPGPRHPAGSPGRAPLKETWPDPAAVLLTALGPGPRLWERDSRHAETLVVRLGTADRPATDGARSVLAAVPVTVGLREAGSLGLAGPRERLTGLARWTVAQLTALHSPADLEIVVISADRTRSLEQRKQDWGWLGWLPHTRPSHGQDCRLLLAYDRDQAAARTAELSRRLDDGPLGPGWASAGPVEVAQAAARHDGPHTVVIVDGDPGSAALRESAAQLAGAGSAAGIHLVCLAETPAASPLSPVTATYEEACAVSLPFRECGAVALLSGDVATALRLLRTAVGQPAGHGTVAVVDAVSPAWADRFARALAPLRAAAGSGRGRPAAVLPQSARLLDELGLARATPASLMARWASAADRTGDCTAVLGSGPHGPVSVDLTDEGPHLLIEGPAGSGRTELLRSVAASLSAAGRPDRLGLLLVDGAGGERGEGLSACTELPHVTDHLVASDPVRMRHFAQALGAELKRRAELLGRLDFTEWHSRHEGSERVIGQRAPSAAEQRAARRGESRTDQFRTDQLRADQTRVDQTRVDQQHTDQQRVEQPHTDQQLGDQRDELDSQTRGTLRLRTPSARTDQFRTDPARTDQPHAEQSRPDPSRTDKGRPDPSRPDPSRTEQTRATEQPQGIALLPRLVVLVDDFDALVAPALGSPGRPAAGSVVRALEAVARDGERLGVHLVATSARPDRTVDTELAQGARLRVVLDTPPAVPAPDEPAPGRGRLGHPDGRVTPFQGGRVTGRIPRTGTLRPTVVVLEWERMGDPPTRRPVRELGNGPTDLALLASALERAARSVDAVPVAPLDPARP
ncbi:FHA domain-containing protein [Streptomyces sp. NPDC088400]|uniref:FHA domain-containing protein n=1 Tax=Streptomyces sp. NPDC088400 TaxID=3365861 RepID=UPI0037F6BAFE